MDVDPMVCIHENGTWHSGTRPAITRTWQRPCWCLLSMSANYLYPLPLVTPPLCTYFTSMSTLNIDQNIWSWVFLFYCPVDIAVLQFSRFDLYVYWKRYGGFAVFWSRYKDIIGLIITNFTLNCTRITHYRRRGAGPMPAPASHRPLLHSIYNTQICFNCSLGQLFAI